MFTAIIKKITFYVHCYYKEKIRVMFTVITKKLLVMVTVHCCYKEDNLLCSLLLQRKLLVMIAVVIKINCYGHCCYKKKFTFVHCCYKER